MTSGLQRDRAGRIVAECYSNAEEFAGDFRAFLDALTEPLDDLCSAYGLPLPGDFGAIFAARLEEAS